VNLLYKIVVVEFKESDDTIGADTDEIRILPITSDCRDENLAMQLLHFLSFLYELVKHFPLIIL